MEQELEKSNFSLDRKKIHEAFHKSWEKAKKTFIFKFFNPTQMQNLPQD